MEKKLSWNLKPYYLELVLDSETNIINYFKTTGSSECWHKLDAEWIELYKSEIGIEANLDIATALENMSLESIGKFVNLVESKTTAESTWQSSF